MRRSLHGPSLYYTNDKNIFDALNEHKVDATAVAGLFEKRNTIVSEKATREELAFYFSGLIHDYYDHKEIAEKLGVVPRRERITSMDVVVSDATQVHLDQAILKVSKDLQEFGDVVTVTRSGGIVTLHVQYTAVDYKRSEFNQVQVRDGLVEFHSTAEGYTVRNTQNENMNAVRESLLNVLEISSEVTVERREVSLLAYPDPKTRSNFFFDLFSELPGYALQDVTDVFVYKPSEDIDEDAFDDEVDSHVERVSLKGTGLTRSEFLSELAESGYFTFRVGWKAKDQTSLGNVYAVEAVFADPKNCTEFSFIVLGVHQNVDGTVMKKRRAPMKGEVAELSRAIEGRARELMDHLRNGVAASPEDED